MELEAQERVDLALHQRLDGVEVGRGHSGLGQQRGDAVGVNDQVTAIKWHVVLVEQALGFTQLGHVQVGGCTADAVGNGQAGARSAERVQDQLVLTTTHGRGNHLHQFLALVEVDLGLAEDVAVLSGVPVLQSQRDAVEAHVQGSHIGLSDAGSGNATANFGEFDSRAFDTSTRTNSAHQHCFALVGLFDFSVEERHKGIA